MGQIIVIIKIIILHIKVIYINYNILLFIDKLDYNFNENNVTIARNKITIKLENIHFKAFCTVYISKDENNYFNVLCLENPMCYQKCKDPINIHNLLINTVYYIKIVSNIYNDIIFNIKTTGKIIYL